MKALSWSLIALGAAIIALSEKIVFPGLELLLGIETIVGKENVVYLEEGGYVFTNPGAMIQRITTAALVGISALGAVFVLLRMSRKRSCANNDLNAIENGAPFSTR